MSKAKTSTSLTAYREYVESIVEYCSGIIFAGEYKIRIFHSKYAASDADVESAGVGDTNASISVDPVYLQANITVYPVLFAKWKERQYKRLAAILLHECCHILTQPLIALYKPCERPCEHIANCDVLERQTTRIQNAIAGALPDDWFEPSVVMKKMKTCKSLPRN